jgi:hypothetical protein
MRASRKVVCAQANNLVCEALYMTPVQQAEDVIAKYQLMLYSVPYCVEVMSGLLKRIKELETQLDLFRRSSSNVDPM